MRAHAAVWIYAQQYSNPYAKAYASKRSKLQGINKVESDSKWLRGRGGMRLRQAWFLVPEARQNALDTPANTFPNGKNGIIDERTSRGRRTSKTATAEKYESSTSSGESNSQLRLKLAAMTRARTHFHEVTCKEKQLRIHAGSFIGALTATIKSVRSAIFLAHATDSPSSVEDAFVAVCSRLTDVFTSVLGATKFAPEPNDDPPCEEYSKTRIHKAEAKFLDALRDLQQVQNDSEQVNFDAPILEESNIFFGTNTASCFQ
ncbi:hypothetical protein PHMEG_00036215 [Phytophthora megakarya]|uniref:Uncharacterized protein n=1 Tax=Phytophthora megakarya TaxID=4795 RepID=A0A225UMI8_9STRA|nr:hypothetical protein PHMEG_00036215 [Phytophthora megakarya]